MITTFPAWSGTSTAVHVGFGGNSWLKTLMRFSDMAFFIYLKKVSKLDGRDVGDQGNGEYESAVRKGETTRGPFCVTRQRLR